MDTDTPKDTETPERKPEPMRALIKQSWHKLNRRQKSQVAALVAAMLDDMDDCLSPMQRIGFDQVRPRPGRVDGQRLGEWLVLFGYMTDAGEMGERTLLRIPRGQAAP